MVDNIETANRYFKYDLCADNTVNGLRFNIPPLVENQFSTHYKACLVKIRSVYIQTDTEAKVLDWSDGTTANILPRGGIKVETNLISRNYASMGGGNAFAGIVSSSGNNNPINQRYGIQLKLDQENVNALAQGCYTYEDGLSLFSTGLICSMPFGNVLEIKFVESIGSNPTTSARYLHPTLAGGTAVAGTTRVEIEFYLIQ
tara:strand:+ start:358 stop:960 length:603 start_codon:yes stop_codon:yes gene_type:complete